MALRTGRRTAPAGRGRGLAGDGRVAVLPAEDPATLVAGHVAGDRARPHHHRARHVPRAAVLNPATAELAAVVVLDRAAGDGERAACVAHAAARAGGVAHQRVVGEGQHALAVDAAAVGVRPGLAAGDLHVLQQAGGMGGDRHDPELAGGRDHRARGSGPVDGDVHRHRGGAERQRAKREVVGSGGCRDAHRAARRRVGRLFERRAQCAPTGGVGADAIAGMGVMGVGGRVDRELQGRCLPLGHAGHPGGRARGEQARASAGGGEQAKFPGTGPAVKVTNPAAAHFLSASLAGRLRRATDEAARGCLIRGCRPRIRHSGSGLRFNVSLRGSPGRHKGSCLNV